MSSFDDDLVENQEFSVETTQAPLAMNDRYMTDEENRGYRNEPAYSWDVARTGFIKNEGPISKSRISAGGPTMTLAPSLEKIIT